jgi:outer membrane protein insertion porin family
LLAALLPGLLQALPAQPALPPTPPTIERIRFAADGPVAGISAGDLEKLLLLRAGEPFSEVLARDSVRRIFATERFHDVQIERLPTAGGVEVVVRLIRRYLIRRIRFEGESEVATRLLRRELTLREGEPFSQERLEESMERIRGAMRRQGYPHARVETAWEVEPVRALLDVTFRIEAGKPVLVGEFRVDPEGEFAPEEIIARMDTRPGRRFSQELFAEELERLKRWLARRGYFNPEVYLRDGADVQTETDRVGLELRVVPRERTQVIFEGIELSERELDSLPLYRNQQPGRLPVEETAQELRHRLQQDGYFRARVDSSVQGTDFPPESVHFRVDAGRRYELSEILFEGASALAGAELERVLTSRRAGLFSRGLLTDESVRQDRERIQLSYQRLGFLDAEVEPEMTDSGGRLFLVFRIREGPRYRVGEIVLEGHQAFAQEELLSALGFQAGDPFSPFLPAAGRTALLSHYDRRGYRDVRVEPRLVRRQDQAVDIHFLIHEGNRFEVEDVVVTGNHATRRSVFEREIQVAAGQPLSLERNLQAETSLYNLSVFNRVRVREIPGREPARQRLVLFSVQEARKYSLFYGLGYSHSFGSLASEGLRGTFGISDANFLGAARTLSLNLRAGSRQQRANLTYNLPRLLGRPLPTVLSFTVDNEERISEDVAARTVRLRGRPYDAFRLIGSAQSERRLSRRESLFFRYQFQNVRLDVPADLEEPLQLFREESRLRLSTLSVSYLNESRDDPTDPHSGFFLNGDVSLAARPWGSQRQYVRFLAQGRYYHPLYTDLTLASSLRIGVIEPFGGGLNPVPISERFFAGGPTTLRGLPVDLAGPLLRDPETGEVLLLTDNKGRKFPVPLGGNALLVGNVELRFPVWNRLGGILFLDAGNVFPGIAELGGGEVSSAAGLGLAIRTPIGPIRLDLAYNPDPPRIEGFKHWNLHLNIGHPF